MTAEGSGIGRIDGMVVFVPLTAVGDTVRVKIVKAKKTYAYGIIDTIITPAAERISPDCPVFAKCGGCTFRHINYNAELSLKDGFVCDSFKRIGGFDELEIGHTMGCEAVDNYRNKAQYPVADLNGQAVCGFYARNSHRVVPFTACRLQAPIFESIVNEVLKYANAHGIPAYNELNGKGLLRHIYLRRGFHTFEIMLCLIVSKKSALKNFQPMFEELMQLFPDIKSCCININSENTNVILGNKTVFAYGMPEITDIMCGNSISLSPLSFYQVNTPQAELLYKIARDYAELNENDTLLDLYCGAGTIGLSMASSVKKLIGVEIIPEAVENARKNAAANNINNAEFICGDASEISQTLASRGERPDVIVVDPPRKGCDSMTLEAIVKMSPSRIVMISCNPATAARDCAMLNEMGYVPRKIQPVDLFPRTGHVETVVFLDKL